jgi:predicted aspartyl protease
MLPFRLLAAMLALLAPQDAAPPDLLALGEQQARMTVPVTVAGSGPYPFIIDTGAERSVISRQLAETLRLPAGPSARVTSMTGTARTATVRVPSLGIGAIRVERMLTAPMFEAVHLGAHGLLGIDQLRDRLITIDFDRDVMEVRPSTARTRFRPVAPDEIVVTARSMLGQLIVTEAEFDGTRIRVVLDTGSQVSMGNGALQRRLRKATRSQGDIALTSVTGERLLVPYAYAQRVRIGGVELRQLPVAFGDVPPFARFGLAKRPALLLGMDALRGFRRVEIDFANREVRFLMPRAG